MPQSPVSSSIAAALFFGTFGALTACTQDFNQFAPSGAGGSGSGGAGGHGGLASSGSLTSSSSKAASSSSNAASSSSTASSSAVASSSSTAASSSSGIPMPEDCTNGIDDDNNGMTDCADPACTVGYTCTPNPPGGWNGPVALYNGAPGGKPMCPANHPNKAYEGNTGILATPAMCSACTCSSPTVTCTPAQVELDSDAQCATPVGMLAQPPAGMCGAIAPPPSTMAAKIPAPVGVANACNASQVMATLPPTQWMTAALACSGGGVGAGCPAKSECVPKTAAPFEAGLCVWRSGDQPCPAGYGTKFLYDDTVVDTRGCSGCTCGAGVPTCSATTTIYNGPNCNGGVSATLADDGTCAAVAGGSSLKVNVTKSGSCPVGGGQPTGTVVPGNVQTTVCCAP